MVGRLRVRGGWGHIAVFICSTRMRRAIVCASMCAWFAINIYNCQLTVGRLMRLVTMCQLQPFLRDLLPFPALHPAQIRMLHKRRRIRRRSAHRFATVHLASHSLGESDLLPMRAVGERLRQAADGERGLGRAPGTADAMREKSS
jgi:hypothetical protein